MWLHGDEIDVPAWHAAGRERHLLDTTAIKNIKNRIQDALAAHERVMSASSAPHGYTELLANPLKPASLPKKTCAAVHICGFKRLAPLPTQPCRPRRFSPSRTVYYSCMIVTCSCAFCWRCWLRCFNVFTSLLQCIYVMTEQMTRSADDATPSSCSTTQILIHGWTRQ